MTLDFELLDDHKVPPTIKPMIKLHDMLVRGWRQDKEVRLPKLISKMEKGISVQGIRKLVDEPCDDLRQSLIDLLDSSCTNIEKRYK